MFGGHGGGLYSMVTQETFRLLAIMGLVRFQLVNNNIETLYFPLNFFPSLRILFFCTSFNSF